MYLFSTKLVTGHWSVSHLGRADMLALGKTLPKPGARGPHTHFWLSHRRLTVLADDLEGNWSLREGLPWGPCGTC